MNKKALATLLMLLPVVAAASSGSSLSFAPPPSDYSVVFLSNIFGIVDGVLHGNGSQIMGNMFGVFNAAVLALGGIVITYTLLVSTINTAHEGQMLGQKWSSMWVPVRATLGLALLIPKASGYCMMQIFVMWVVVQGVGAADKIWASALSYLNRGGVIVQQQINPVTSLMGGNSSVASGASVMLSGQVCMLGVQQLLTNARQQFINQAGTTQDGPCFVSPGQTPSADSPLAQFCNTPVPNFINSVNAISVQNSQPSTVDLYSAPMPNFDSGPYALLNGVCGTIKWAPFSAPSLNTITTLGQGEIDTMKKSRAIAVQQMYIDLSSIAQIIVNNNPTLNPQNTAITSGSNDVSVFAGSDSSTSSSSSATPVAQQQFGVPLMTSGSPCLSPSTNCTNWGTGGVGGAPLFNGTEFQGAVSDYNAIMLPTLNMVNQASNSTQANNQRAFIEQSNQEGWITAGSYFFDLAYLNTSNTTTGGTDSTNTPVDTDSQLQQSNFDPGSLSDPFAPTGCSGDYNMLCIWLSGSSKPLQTAVNDVTQLIGLINGSSLSPTGEALPTPVVNPMNATGTTGDMASTVYGFIGNSVLVQLPGQPGAQPPAFVMKLVPHIAPPKLELPNINFPCWYFFLCWGKLLGYIFYTLILKVLLMWVLNFVNALVNLVVTACLILPLQGMSKIFMYGVSFLQQPNVNPVIALANMGVNFINFSNDMWLYIVDTSVTASIFGPFMITLIGLIMPLVLAWMGVMIAVGFITAYYVPFLPYMIFTFGAIGWLMAVIEAMVAAPIVALGITHPEGEGPFGKGEQAIMILMNVFLRPALMIIGYIVAIILSYVGIWVINAGFSHVVTFIQGDPTELGNMSWSQLMSAVSPSSVSVSPTEQADVTSSIGYGGWAGIYGFFFSILIYTTMYLIVIQKAFTLIAMLPDKVLRWIGGQPESIGQETSGWTEDVKKQVGEGGQATAKASGQISKNIGSKALSAMGIEDRSGYGEATPGD